jgi:hypothetical protein
MVGVMTLPPAMSCPRADPRASTSRDALPRPRTLWSWLGCALAFTACGGDGRDPPPYQSGVESDAPVSQLSSTQKQQICQSYGAYVKANVNLKQLATAICLPSSLLTVGLTGSEEDCEKFLDDCSQHLLSGDLQARVDDPQACLASLDRCDAQVAELEGCVNVNLSFPLEILERLSCRHAGQQDAIDAARDVDTASVCAQPDQTCAAFSAPPVVIN